MYRGPKLGRCWLRRMGGGARVKTLEASPRRPGSLVHRQKIRVQKNKKPTWTVISIRLAFSSQDMCRRTTLELLRLMEASTPLLLCPCERTSRDEATRSVLCQIRTFPNHSIRSSARVSSNGGVGKSIALSVFKIDPAPQSRAGNPITFCSRSRSSRLPRAR
jgi:hypothetical protein